MTTPPPDWTGAACLGVCGFHDTAPDSPAGTATECPATRHGTRTAYQMDRCRCPEALEAERVYKVEYRKRVYLKRGALKVPNVGTRRRIRALQALGWPLHVMDVHLGAERRTGYTHQLLKADVIHRASAEAVARMYDQLSMRVGPSLITAQRARTAGHLPPLAYDDDRIDDPHYRPARNPRVEECSHVDEIAVEEAIAGRRPRLTALERREAVRRMTDMGLTKMQVAARLGISDKSVDRIRARAKEGLTQGRADYCQAGHCYLDDGVLGRKRNGDRYCRVCKPAVSNHASAA